MVITFSKLGSNLVWLTIFLLASGVFWRDLFCFYSLRTVEVFCLEWSFCFMTDWTSTGYYIDCLRGQLIENEV